MHRQNIPCECAIGSAGARVYTGSFSWMKCLDRMKIADSHPIRNTGALKRKTVGTSSPASGFAEMIESLSAGGADTATGSGDAAAVSGVGLLLAQEVTGEEYARRQALRQGHTMLDSLERLRTALLMGAVPPDVLRELDQRLSRQRAQVADPHLSALMDDIELRVAVEKAKLDKALELQEMKDRS